MLPREAVAIGIVFLLVVTANPGRNRPDTKKRTVAASPLQPQDEAPSPGAPCRPTSILRKEPALNPSGVISCKDLP